VNEESSKTFTLEERKQVLYKAAYTVFSEGHQIEEKTEWIILTLLLVLENISKYDNLYKDGCHYLSVISQIRYLMEKNPELSLDIIVPHAEAYVYTIESDFEEGWWTCRVYRDIYDKEKSDWAIG